jgi:hypothetical protein
MKSIKHLFPAMVKAVSGSFFKEFLVSVTIESEFERIDLSSTAKGAN